LRLCTKASKAVMTLNLDLWERRWKAIIKQSRFGDPPGFPHAKAGEGTAVRVEVGSNLKRCHLKEEVWK
jgi:hypothetical protein